MGNLSTPDSVQKLQTALHAKAKAEPGYRFYALYDKISREDILAHAYAQCRSNKGAPGVDRQDFEAVEEYGVERWLGELALALRQETYRPEPIRRVYIPKANGKLRPLGISTLRDRVCMTAAMLVLEPIFEADLPSELYAYRPGRNAQQAVVEVEELLFRGHPDVVDADLADYFGSIPHADLLKSAARRIVDRRWGLYVHVCKMETLRAAYEIAKQNDGAPGVDGVTFEAIEAQGVEALLGQLRDELTAHTYTPLPTRRQEIPKDGGRVRVLSIPAIRDRVVQGALKLILEPVFEADFQPGCRNGSADQGGAERLAARRTWDCSWSRR